MRFYPKTIEVCCLWNANLESHTCLPTRYVIRDHRVTKCVTSPYATTCSASLSASNASGWVPLATIPLPRPKSESVFKRSSCTPPGPASAPRPASTPLAPACWVDAPARCIGASDLAHWVNACARWVSTPAPVRHALGRCPRPLRTGSASPTLRAVWMHPAPASAPVLVLVPPR